jgi:hypothetical protein
LEEVRVFCYFFLSVFQGPAAPQSALPIGAESKQDPVRLVEVYPTPDLVHSVLAVSHSKTPEGVLESNVAGFIVVYVFIAIFLAYK